MPEPQPTYDALVIGGGPAGSAAALALARAGRKVRVFERAAFPRFHIGESLLPGNMTVFRALGLAEDLAKLTQVEKRGADFEMGDGSAGAAFTFDMGLVPGETIALNIERAPMDAMLLRKAADAGAEIDHGAAVRSIDRLEDGDVAVTTSRGEQVAARWLIDASGQSTVVGKHLGLRKMLPHLKKIAFFGHFDNVWRHPGARGGSPTIVMCDEGWFWLIPLDATRMSIGLVMHLDVARQVGLPNDEMLFWGIARSAVLRERTANAVFPQELYVAADFSYRCEPFAGPGYFLAGDAATFVDPIFSTGVCLGMMGGSEAGTLVDDLLAGRTTPAAARKRYIRTIRVGSSAFFRMVYLYYDHSFRELFLGGGSPMKIHNAVLSVLAGNVFPDVPFTLKWRLWMLSLLVKVHRVFPLAKRHKVFSLRTAQPLPLPQVSPAGAASPATPEAPLPGAA